MAALKVSRTVPLVLVVKYGSRKRRKSSNGKQTVHAAEGKNGI